MSLFGKEVVVFGSKEFTDPNVMIYISFSGVYIGNF